jgi:DNA-binding NarL/FixJ family response regulator
LECAIFVLIVSDCARSLSVLADAFEAYGIKTVVRKTGLAGFEALRQVKFDLMVLDLDCVGAASLLDAHIGKFPGNRTTVIALNLDEGRVTPAQRKKVHYTLPKPLTAHMAVQTLKAAYNAIVMEKRVSFRCARELTTLEAYYHENNASHPLVGAVLLDISSTGFCLKARSRIPQGVTLFVNFRIPGEHQNVHAVGRVAWSDAQGRAGAEFRYVPAEEFTVLRNWLYSQFPWAPELTALPVPSARRPEQQAKSF